MPQILRALREGYTPLRNRNFRIYWSAQAVSVIGTVAQSTGQSWLAWRLTHSGVALGIVGMLATLPMLFLGLAGGVVADRMDRRRILMWTQCISMTAAIALGSLVTFGVVAIWHVYLLALVIGCVTAIEMPTHQAFLGDLAGPSEVRKAIVLNSSINQGGRLIAPAIAGWLIGVCDVGPLYFINAVSFLAVLAGLSAIRSMHVRPTAAPAHPLHDLKTGFQILTSEPRFLDMVWLCLAITCFSVSNAQVYPLIASRVLHGDASTLGLLLAASGAGALISVLVVVPLVSRLHRTGTVLLASVVWAGAAYFAFSFTTTLAFAAPCLFLAALAYPVVSTTAGGFLSAATAPALRARVLSTWMTVTLGFAPFASLLTGIGSEHLGAPRMVRLNALALIVIGVSLYCWRGGLAQWSATAMLRRTDAAAHAPLAVAVPVRDVRAAVPATTDAISAA